MKKSLTLFFYFFYLGLFTFGGGLAMLPFIKKHAISKGWIDEPSWDGIVTLSQLSPGAIAVNCANLIGYRVDGRKGSLVAVLGMTLPSILVILLIAIFLQDALLIPWVVSALKGILLSVSILFILSFFDLSKPLNSNKWLFAWTITAFLLVVSNLLSPIIVMGISIPLAMLYSIYRVNKVKK
jgi:chromate transporter